MQEQAAFRQLLERIVEDAADEHIDVLAVDGDRIVDGLFRGADPRALYARGGVRGEFGVGLSDVSLVADLLSIAAATFTVWRWCAGAPKVKADVATRWAAAMVEQGMPAARAADLATRFAGELGDAVAAVESVGR